MRIVYNGVDLFVLETHEYKWEAVYDDTTSDYLFTRVSIHVTAIVNGQVGVSLTNGPYMSYKFTGVPTSATPGVPRTPTEAVPYSTAGTSVGGMLPSPGTDVGYPNAAMRGIEFTPSRPFTSQMAVRHRLLMPRGQLFVFADSSPVGVPDPGNLSLASPSLVPLFAELRSGLFTGSPGFASAATDQVVEGISRGLVRPCDCKKGPLPRVFDVTQVMSQDNTWVVDWAVETYVNEAEENSISPSGALLSNQFRQRQVVDDRGYTTTFTSGLAVFRADYIYGTSTNPDSFRATLFMPIPQGFERSGIEVEEAAEVTGIRYSYQDTQVPVNFVAGPLVNAAKIVVMHRQAVSTGGDILTGVLSFYDRATSTLLNNKWLRESGDEAAKKAARSGKAKALPPPPKPTP